MSPVAHKNANAAKTARRARICIARANVPVEQAAGYLAVEGRLRTSPDRRDP